VLRNEYDIQGFKSVEKVMGAGLFGDLDAALMEFVK